eukprot:450225_1
MNVKIRTCVQRISKRNYSVLTKSNLLSSSSIVWKSESIDKAHTPPQEWYTNEEIYNLEQSLLFKKYPQYVGHTQQLTEQKGSYFAGRNFNEPFIVIRQNDLNEESKIRSFYNVCRHHASQLTSSDNGLIDCNKGLQCPYHGWTYNINGQLTKATQMKGIKDFKPKNYGLLSIPQHLLFDKLIFLNLAVNQSESHGTFEDIIKSVTKYNDDCEFKNNNLTHVYSRKYLLKCNWKVFVENYLDGGYHVPYLHIGLNNNLNPDTYTTVVDNYVSFQSVASSQERNDNENGVDFAERIGNLGLYTYIYPNFMINRYGKWMDINYVYPKNVDETYVHFDYFIEGTDGINDDMIQVTNNNDEDLMKGCFYNLNKFNDDEIKFIKESIVASHQVQFEDEWICELVSNGLKSSAYKSLRGRYASLETALYKFHQLYNKDMFATE